MGNDPDDQLSAEDRFGLRVRYERERLGWTQAYLSQRLREDGLEAFHPSTVAKIEHRKARRPRMIRLDEARALSRVFGVSLEEMLSAAADEADALVADIYAWLHRLTDETDLGVSLLERAERLVSLSETAEQADRVQGTLQVERLRALIEALPQERIPPYLSTLRHPSQRLEQILRERDDGEHREEV